MKRSAELQRQIANRETELQRAWDYYKQQKKALDEEHARLSERLIAIQDERLIVLAGLAKCRRRAIEQDCNDIL